MTNPKKQLRQTAKPEEAICKYCLKPESRCQATVRSIPDGPVGPAYFLQSMHAEEAARYAHHHLAAPPNVDPDYLPDFEDWRTALVGE